MSMSGSRLGAAMYNALQAYDKGKTPADARGRMIAIGNAIVAEIGTYATISPITCTDTPIIGTSVHSHAPVVTQSSTGKIS